MTSLDIIRSKIQGLYNTNPSIHVNISITKPKINLSNQPVVIKGVYSHIFQIEERLGAFPKRYTLQYTDVLLRNVVIIELE